MAVKFTNNARTTLAADISNSATTATVTSGSVFPVLNAGEYFYCTFDNGTNNEIVKVTARSGNTLTIVRGVDNTTARAFSTDDAAELRATAGLLTDIQENIAAKSANQTVYNATTASSATDYDIGIDPGLESNAMVFLNGVMQHHDTFSFSGSTLTFDTAPSNGLALEVIVDNLINLQSSNLTVDTFTAADVGGNPQVDFVLSDAPAGETNLIVFVDGVFQANDTYTISSTTLSMTDGVTADMVVTVYVMNPVNIGAPSDNTVTSSKLSGNITMPADLTVTGDVAFDSPTFVVDNANSRVGIGTASPSTLLDIVGDVKMSANLTVDTTTLVVDATNNRVGIGTSSPSKVFNVVGTYENTGFYRDYSGAGIGANYVYIGRKDTNGALVDGVRISGGGDDAVAASHTGYFELAINKSGTFIPLLYSSNGTELVVNESSVDLDFRVESNGNSHMLFVDGGNDRVGIGTAGPTEKLDINGGAVIKGSLTNGAGTGSALRMQHSSNISEILSLEPGVAWRELRTNASQQTFYIAGGERMRIDSSGNVGLYDGQYINWRLAPNSTYRGGIRCDSSANMSFETGSGGAERMRIDSSGNVNVGGTTNFGLFTVTQSTDTNAGGIGVVDSGNAKSGRLWSNGTNIYLSSGATGTGNLVLNEGGGNVGIATTSPAAPLDVKFVDNTNAQRWSYGSSEDNFYLELDTNIPTGGVVTYNFNTKNNGTSYNNNLVLDRGNVGIGTTSPDRQLEVYGANDGYMKFDGGRSGNHGYTVGSDAFGFVIYDDTSGAYRLAISQTTGAAIFGNYTSYAHNTYAHAAVFSKNSTPQGTVVIEDSDVSSGIGNTVLRCYLRDQDPAGTATFIDFADGGGRVGSVSHNDDGGGVSYNTTSDYRLKENVNYDWDALSLVNQLKPAKFNFLSNPAKTVQGFLAHEVSDIVPSSVRGNKDHIESIGTVTDSDGNVIYEDVYEHFCKTDEGQTWTRTGEEPLYQQLDYSRIVPLLTKAIQEQQTQIETLKQEIREIREGG